jgi:hypothetical protein
VLFKYSFGNPKQVEQRSFKIFTIDELKNKQVEFLCKHPIDSHITESELFFGFWKTQKIFGITSSKLYRIIPLASVSWIERGHKSVVFRSREDLGLPLPKADTCFTVMTKERSIDVACGSVQECTQWVTALRYLVENIQTKSGRPVYVTKENYTEVIRATIKDVKREQLKTNVIQATPRKQSANSILSEAHETPWNGPHKKRYLGEQLLLAVNSNKLEDAVIALEDGSYNRIICDALILL